MNTLMHDLKYGSRMLVKSPGFTAVAVIALALGIGANTLIFSVVNAVMLRPLPFAEPARLMMLFHSYPKINLPRASVSPYGFLYYRDHAKSFSSLGAMTMYVGPQNLTGNGEPERVKTVMVSAGFFPTLGIAPKMGRTFLPEEDRPGNEREVVLGNGIWRQRFGADPNILNKTIALDGQNYTVIGVMPDGFQMPSGAALWLPLALDPAKATLQQLGNEYLEVIGRLKPGVTPQQANAELSSISEELLKLVPQGRAVQWHVMAVPLNEITQEDLRPALLVLLAAVGCVLLIACANVASLLLARAAARQKEIAIRSALGATRLRLIRQTLTESVLLSLLGGVLGLALGGWGTDLMLALVPMELPSMIHITVDSSVLAFTFTLSLATGLLFGAVPALQLSSARLTDTLKEGGRTSQAQGHGRMREALVVAETAVALMLLIGAGLMIRSFIQIQQNNPGFDAGHVGTGWVALTEQRYKKPEQMTAFYQQLLERMSAEPGVKQVAIGSGLPLIRSASASFDIVGRDGLTPHAFVTVVSPRYFDVLRVPLLAGRAFAETDSGTAPKVVIVDAKLVRAYFPHEDPIGKKIVFGRDPLEIVGIVGGVKHVSIFADDTKGQVYLPYLQSPEATMSVVLRSDGDPLAVAGVLRRHIAQLDPNQALYDVKSMDQYLNDYVAQPRFNMVLLGIFAGLALLLATVGLYGVISYSVSQRVHEFGIRMALGAPRAQVLRMVLAQALRLAIVGIACGLVGSFMLTRLVQKLLFGVKATDLSTFAAIPLLLAVVAIVASYIPARRATRVDPMVALRYE